MRLTFEKRPGCPEWCRGHLPEDTDPDPSHMTASAYVEGAPLRYGSPSVSVWGTRSIYRDAPTITVMRHADERTAVRLELADARDLAVIADAFAPDLAAALREVIAVFDPPEESTS